MTRSNVIRFPQAGRVNSRPTSEPSAIDTLNAARQFPQLYVVKQEPIDLYGSFNFDDYDRNMRRSALTGALCCLFAIVTLAYFAARIAQAVL